MKVPIRSSQGERLSDIAGRCIFIAGRSQVGFAFARGLPGAHGKEWTLRVRRIQCCFPWFSTQPLKQPAPRPIPLALQSMQGEVE